MKPSAVAALVAFIMLGIGTARAQAITIPTPDEAKAAIGTMFNDPDLSKALTAGHVKLGTCKKTSKASHDGEVSCTALVAMGAGSSETQVNFYRAGGTWVATPSKEDLPFPDPKLR